MQEMNARDLKIAIEPSLPEIAAGLRTGIMRRTP